MWLFHVLYKQGNYKLPRLWEVITVNTFMYSIRSFKNNNYYYCHCFYLKLTLIIMQIENARNTVAPNKNLSSHYHKVKFSNTSISSLGSFENSYKTFMQMYKDLDFDKKGLKFFLMKLLIIIIRTTYYIFCMRNKPWTYPDLPTY